MVGPEALMLAVTGGKGGTGKTTTALGLAAALVDRRREPVVIDADVDMPNLHIRADVDGTGLAALADGKPLSEAATESPRYPGVSVVGATPGADLPAALRQIATDRPVILDGAAGASERAVTPLRYADAAIAVTRATPASVTDTVKTLRMARAVRTPILGVLASRTETVTSSMKTALPHELILPIPSIEDPIEGDQARVAYETLLEASHEQANA